MTFWNLYSWSFQFQTKCRHHIALYRHVLLRPPCCRDIMHQRRLCTDHESKGCLCTTVTCLPAERAFWRYVNYMKYILPIQMCIQHMPSVPYVNRWHCALNSTTFLPSGSLYKCRAMVDGIRWSVSIHVWGRLNCCLKIIRLLQASSSRRSHTSLFTINNGKARLHLEHN